MKRGFGLGVVTTLLAVNVMQYWFVANANQRGPSTLDSDVAYEQSIGTSTSRQTPIVTAVQKVSPSVVAITTEVATQNPFSWMGTGLSSSEGSGVVIDTQGIVLTNAHVVNGAIRIEATFSDDSTYTAKVVGIAPELDLAVLRLDKDSTSTAVDIGSSESLLLGESVIALGNPFGLGHTVTTGVISAIKRPVQTERRIYQDFIQTDASINPGNSGGPLVNIYGELIGINTAIRSDAEGIGFAIPVDRAMKVANDLLNFGVVQRPWLGVDIQDAAVQVNGRRQVAPEVSWIYEEGANLQKGDIIVELNGKKVQSRGDLNAYLSTLKPNGQIQLKIWRAGMEQTVSIQTSSLPDAVVDMALEDVLGIEVSIRQGAVVTSKVIQGGAFAKNGLRAGDFIVAVNGQSVQSMTEIRTILSNAKSDHKGSAVFTIRRGRYQGQVELPI
jgi:serine protease Do